jgi:hypothetical protein
LKGFGWPCLYIVDISEKEVCHYVEVVLEMERERGGGVPHAKSRTIKA